MDIQSSALTSSIVGLKRGMENVRKDAQDIANAGTAPLSSTQTFAEYSPGKSPSKSTDEGLVNLIVDTHQVEASAKVMQTENELIGSLLNEMA